MILAGSRTDFDRSVLVPKAVGENLPFCPNFAKLRGCFWGNSAKIQIMLEMAEICGVTEERLSGRYSPYPSLRGAKRRSNPERCYTTPDCFTLTFHR